MTSIQIDHIVLLVSTPFFENPPAWLTTNFTITPGGCHNGQASRNKLIIFADGSYLELFNWYDKPPPLDDENLPMRFWGPKQEGLIDFALTSTTVPAEECIDAVNRRLTQGTRQRRGSWRQAPGTYCRLSQEGRVASDNKAKTTHPCGATGIAACEILVPQDRLAEYVTLYSKILGSKPEAIDDEAGGRSFTLDFGVPQGAGRAKVVVREARTEKELNRMQERGVGFSDPVIATNGQVAEEKCSFGPQGIESAIWLENLAPSTL